MKKSTATKGRAPPVVVTPEPRYHMISDAAYFRTLKHQQETGEADDEAESWCEVEAEVDEILKRHHAK
jgi:hypothetical protein